MTSMPPGRSCRSRAAASRARNDDADLAAHFGLDKSTVSRQLEQLISAGLLRREGERPGRRGCRLALTTTGEQHLAAAAQAVRCRLAEWLTDWDEHDVAAFGQLVSRFNQSTTRTYLAG